MSDWTFLNKARVRTGLFGSDDDAGFNGYFCVWLKNERVKILASDGFGWQHVSVSLQDKPTKTPSWEIMSLVKDLFWDETECVVQFHPPKSEYVNNHPGCLHLWRQNNGQEFPMPPKSLVGIQALGTLRP